MRNKKNKNLFSDFPEISSSQWEEKIKKDLKGQDYYKKLVWKTINGFDLKPYYRKDDLKELTHLEHSPGNYPFVRGNTNENDWDICVEITNKNIAKANKEAINTISKGATSVVFDVSELRSKRQFFDLLNNINLQKVSFLFKGSSSYLALLGYIKDLIKEKEIDSQKFNASFEFDAFSDLLINDDSLESPEKSIKNLIEIIEISDKDLPQLKVINIRGDIYNNSGASTVQELAFALSAANEYLSKLTDKSLEIDKIAPKIQFTFATDSDYFIEIAKIRAIRYLWALIVEQYNPKTKESGKTKIHSTTSSWNKSIYDPYTNMLRLTTEAMSSVIGGTDSLLVNPFDQIFTTSGEFSKRIARNLQLLLKEESHFDKVVDPAAGSYYIESTTNSLIEKSFELFKEIQRKGGFLEAVKSGFIQNEVEKTATQQREMLLKKKKNVLGTSIFPNSEEKIIDNLDKNIKNKTAFKKLKISRLAIPFEELRLATERFEKNGGQLPKVFIVPIGNPAMASARQIFSRNFFACAAFDIVENARFPDSTKAINSSLDNKANIVVICSSDNEYKDLATNICKGIKNKNKDIFIVVAGNPVEEIENLKNAGIDDFIHLKTNILDSLKKYQKHFKII